MHLHIYRNAEDRRSDLKSAARSTGCVLATNAWTTAELARRLAPSTPLATAGQRTVLIRRAVVRARMDGMPGAARYAGEALDELISAGISAEELRQAGLSELAALRSSYRSELDQAGLADPADLSWRALEAIDAGLPDFMRDFDQLVLHAVFDPTEGEFQVLRRLTELLPLGTRIELFAATENVHASTLADWMWRRFLNDEALADAVFPEFCSSGGPNGPLIERLFAPDPMAPLPAGGHLQVLRAAGRYHEAETLGGEIRRLLDSGVATDEIVVVVPQMGIYGEMLDNVFSRTGIAVRYPSGIPLMRIPVIKYWLSVLDLATGDRNASHLSRVLSSAYHTPRLSPEHDVEAELRRIGYIDQRHLPATDHARRHGSALLPHISTLTTVLDSVDGVSCPVADWLERLPRPGVFLDRDIEAWDTLCDELISASRIAGPVSFAVFRQLASEIAGLRTIRQRQPDGPAVRVVTPAGLGYGRYRFVFSPGWIDGEFPSPVAGNPLLPDAAVARIRRHTERPVLLDTARRRRRDPMDLFAVLDAASERLVISYPEMTIEGEPYIPSVYLKEVERHFEHPLESPAPPPDCTSGIGSWRRAVAAAWRSGRIDADQALERLGTGVVARIRRERLYEGRGDARGALRVTDTHVWTPSELEDFESCPFVFMARRRLRLRATPSTTFDVSAIDMGNLAHAILRDFHSQPLPAMLEDAVRQMQVALERRLVELDTSGSGGSGVYSPEVWRIRRAQLSRAMEEHVRFALGDMLTGYETVIEFLDKELPPAPLGSVRVGGRADHIAVHRTATGAVDAIRVDDFKYSVNGEFYDRRAREGLQLPVYARLALNLFSCGPQTPVDGRYVLLRSPHDPVISKSIDQTRMADAANRAEAIAATARNGQFHAAPADVKNCGRCDYRRLCRYPFV